MDELNKILAEATEEIGTEYFQLPIAGGAPIYRERVYCYELYHRMRLRWPADCRYCLNGEVDKSGHQIMQAVGASGIPDFLVHRPGDMRGNHAIIEVKSSRPSADFQKDLETLSVFRRRAGYARAIYLIYGSKANEMISRIERSIPKIEDYVPVELWLHLRVGAPAALAKILLP